MSPCCRVFRLGFSSEPFSSISASSVEGQKREVRGVSAEVLNWTLVHKPDSSWLMHSSRLLIISSALSMVPLSFCCSSWRTTNIQYLRHSIQLYSQYSVAAAWDSYLIRLHEVPVEDLLHLMWPGFSHLFVEVISLFQTRTKGFELRILNITIRNFF